MILLGESSTGNKELQSAISMFAKQMSMDDLQISCDCEEMKFTQQLQVGVTSSQEISFTNQSEESAMIRLFFTQTADPHQCEFRPNEFVIKKNETMKVTISLKMCCTSRLNTTIVVVNPARGYSMIPLVAESSVSTFLSLDEVKIGKLIGTGSYGKVFLGKYRGESVAVKQLSLFSMGESEETKLENEVKIMAQLRSPFVVSFYGAVKTADSVSIVLEYCKYGSLSSHLGQNKLNKEVKMLVALDCAKGMQFLHTNNFIHRDLKTDNVLMVSLSEKSPIRGKISDFGTSRVVGSKESQQMTAAVGTPSFVAPEVVGESSSSSEYSLPSDVYSFAMVLWHLFSEVEPYSDFKTVFAIYAFVQSKKRLPLPVNCPLNELIAKCWDQDPSERPTFDDIVIIISLSGQLTGSGRRFLL
eukprot:TRINITY_DN2357_c0_g1_i1.p1 TRINITY_DN2357_c0_g1~~TRINITY_DN2357_c0_g1_i1.p1  ORF type:complete len:414 (+),score=126.53 TRINITY_DN2357_c0_g1_i1:2-1243(+)